MKGDRSLNKTRNEIEQANPRIRTIPGAVKEIRKNDPETAITEPIVRKLVLENKIASLSVGSRIFVEVDKIIEYFQGENGGGR